MTEPIRVLMLEDVAEDAELVARALRKAGIAFVSQRVDTRAEFLRALEAFRPDVALLDYRLPGFDGATALNLLRERQPDVPVIFVTGALGDEGAVELIKAGARDFVLKDRLARLAPAVLAALADAEDRRRREQAERAQRESERRMSEMLARVQLMAVMLDRQGHLTYANDHFLRVTGWPREDALGRDWFVTFVPETMAEGLRRTHADVLGEQPHSIYHENPILTRSGEQRIVRWSNTALRSPQGEVIGAASIGEDITERQRAERALAESEARLREAEALAHLGAWTLDLQTNRLSWSDEIYRIFEIDPQRFAASYDAFLAAIHPEDRERVSKAYADSVAERKPYAMDHRLLMADGRVKFVHERGETSYDADGRPLRTVGTVQDVSERKRAQQALIESELRFRSLIERTSDVVAVAGLDGTLTYVSPAVRELGGYAPEELVGRRFSELLLAEDRDAAQHLFEALIQRPGEPMRIELRFLAKDGSTRNLESVARNLADVPGVSGIVVNLRDVTLRRAMEAGLRLANTLIEQSSSVLFRWVAAPGWPVAYASQNVRRWGYESAELMSGKPLYAELVHPDDLQRITDEVAAHTAAGATRFVQEYRVITRSGETLWVTDDTTVERDAAGTPLFFQGVVTDVTARKLSEEALRESEAMLRGITDAAADAVILLDNDGHIAFWNPAAERILGYTRDEVLGRDLHQLMAPARYRADFEKGFAAFRDSGQGPVIGKTLELEALRKDGAELPVELAVSALQLRGRWHGIGLLRDITQRKEYEALRTARLQRIAAQLEALGRIVHSAALSTGDVTALAREITEAATRAVGTERANVWLFNADESELLCIDSYEATPARHSAGQRLTEAQFGNEFEALRKGRFVNADDALTDPRTAGYVEGYVKPLGITSMLDTVVMVAGRRAGLMCLEHVNRPHRWQDDEIAFAGQLADQIGFCLAAAQQRAADVELRRANRALRTLSSGNVALARATSEPALLESMCRAIVEAGGYRMAWIGYAQDDADKSVQPMAWAGTGADYAREARVSWADTERGRGSVGRCIRSGTTQTTHDIAADPAMAPWHEAAARYGFRSTVALPLRVGDGVIGALAIYSADVGPFAGDELTLLEELAADVSFGISAMRAHEAQRLSEQQIERGLAATVQALAATVELRDPYTAGHQRHVAEIAARIAREMGLDEDRVQGLTLAATIHDIGKVNIPAEILSKPGRLSRTEYELIKTHAESGYQILKDVNFPWPVAEMIHQHHERIDGSGYPRGLKADQILLEAKIIAVADVLEAITAHRPYRPAKGIDAALEEIVAGRGRLYDEATADACLRLFRERGYRIPE